MFNGKESIGVISPSINFNGSIDIPVSESTSSSSVNEINLSLYVLIMLDLI